MKKIILTLTNQSANLSYPIFIGTDIIEKISTLLDLKKYSKAFIITDNIIKPLLLKKLVSALPIGSDSIVLPAGEKEKNIENVQKIWTAMQKAGCDRKSLVINLGGGVIGDMGGFATSTYMRGIDFIQIPTTLLAQVDASVGGKTGIDFAGIKNIIGTFNQPVGVIIDIQTLKSLPKREFLSGFAEIIKHGLIQDENYFRQVTSKPPLQFDQDELIDIITGSCEIKKNVVQNDQTEGGPRKLLNFGHTVGHAVEALSLETSTPLLHGEAISVGMMVEAKISQLLGKISEQDLKTIQDVFKNVQLPVTVSDLRADKVIQKMLSDKKNENGKINFTLLEAVGKGIIDQNVSDDIIKQALQFVSK